MNILFFVLLKLEVKLKDATLAKPIWVHLDLTSILLDKCLANGQAKTYAFFIQTVVWVINFAEGLEKFLLIFWCDTYATITNLDYKAPQLLTVSSCDLDKTLVSELERVFDQVDQHLL